MRVTRRGRGADCNMAENHQKGFVGTSGIWKCTAAGTSYGALTLKMQQELPAPAWLPAVHRLRREEARVVRGRARA